MKFLRDDISPLFLIGSERSGTNLLRKLITQHQNTYFGPPPAHFLKHLYATEPYYQINHKMDASSFKSMVEDALNLCYVHWSPWDIKFDVDEVVLDYAKNYKIYNSILLSHYLMSRYASEKGYKSYFCKDNYLFDFVFEILAFIPNAKFVYLYRDPRDFAVSQKKRTLQTDSIRLISKMWRDEQTKCLAAINHLNSDQVISLSYEDLISAHPFQIERICKFLGVDYRRDPSETAIMNGPVVTKEWENLDKPVMVNNSKKYIKYLSSMELRAIESITYRQMDYLGYERSEIKHTPKLYNLYDEIGLHLFSVARRKYLPDARDNWMKSRAKMLARIAQRRT